MATEENGVSPLWGMNSKFKVFLNRQTSNYKVLLIYGFISSIFAAGVGVGFGGGQYVTLYIVALGATPAMLGLFSSVRNAVNSVTSTPLGWMMDRYNLKKLMLIGMILQYIPPLIYIFSGYFGFYLWLEILSRIISTIASGLTMSSIMLLFTKSLRGEDRATGYSIRTIFQRIAGLVTPMLWAFVVTSFGGLTVEGIRPLFFISLIGRTVTVLWIYFKLDVSNPEKPPSSVGKRSSPIKGLSSFLQDIRDVFKVGKGVARWILASCCDIFAFSLIMGFTALFAVEVKGADAYILGFMGTALTATTLLLTIPIGRLCDKLGRKKGIYLGLPPMYGWILLLLYAPSPIYLVVSQIFYGILMATFPIWNIITMELVPEAYRGRFRGVKDLFTNLVSIPASFMAGLIWTMFDPKLLFFMALAFESAAVIIAKTIPETREMGKTSNS